MMVRCSNIVTDKYGQTRVCGRKLGDIEGRYVIICPKCKKVNAGDTRREGR